MNLFGLLQWISDLFGGGPEFDVDEDRIEELVDAAPGPSVTRSVLGDGGKYTYAPLVTYLEPEERPGYVIHAIDVVIKDASKRSSTQALPTRRTLVVFTDRRIVIVVGNRIADEPWGVPYESVIQLDVEPIDGQRFLVLEGKQEGQHVEMYVNVTLHYDHDELADAIAFARERVDATGTETD